MMVRFTIDNDDNFILDEDFISHHQVCKPIDINLYDSNTVGTMFI